MIKKLIIALLLIVSYSSISQELEERYVIKNLAINNEYSNFGTSFYGENKLIFAMPAKRNYIINNTWKGNQQPFLDLYIGDIEEGGELINVKKFSSKLNTKFHESNVTFTKDKRTVYFTRSNYVNGKYHKDSLGINRLKLFRATVGANNEWIDIEPMLFNSDNYSVGHPSLSEDQKTLYFVSDMPGSIGKTDIFKVDIKSDGTYGIPVNLGPDINTIEKEMFPYIDGNDELYYSSDGKEGYGMLDIYMSKLQEDGSVLKTINLGPSINSVRDDFAFIINKEKRSGYFSSNRWANKDDDIFYFVEEKPYIFECNQNINIIVKNKTTKEILPNAYVSIYNDGEIIVDSVIVGKGGYNFAAKCNSNFKIEGEKNKFTTANTFVQTSDDNKLEKNVVLEIEPKDFIVVREKLMIDIPPIYFDYDKSNIRKDASLVLDKVVAVMEAHPEIIVESGSHTDSRGPDAYNLSLSDRRANSTVDYIISQGISPDRISGKGYGETQLTNKCSNGVRCTSEEHQLNRRTEFVIVNPEVLNLN